jgi:large subunit ribosomal protein L6
METMERTADIPKGVEAKLEGHELVVKGPKGELRRAFSSSLARMEIREGSVRVASEKDDRRSKAMVGTWAAHARNMVTGVSAGWEARLKVLYSHFPMKLTVEGREVVINNFLGSRSEKRSGIVGDSRVEIRKDLVIVTGTDREDVGQTAANLETMTKVRRYDRRVFQDGCHLIQKASPAGPAGEGAR